MARPQFLGHFSPLGLLYYGGSVPSHLWFLTALVFSICLVSAFVAFERTHYLLPVAAALPVVGIVGQYFPMLVDVPFPTRDALFFGLLYVALGYRIRSSGWSPSEVHSRRYLAAFVVLFVLQFAEQYAVGVYLLHVPVLYTLIQVGRLVGTTAGVDIAGTLPWHVAVTPVVYALALYLLAARVGLAEPGGSHTPRRRRIRSRFRSTGAVSPLSD